MLKEKILKNVPTLKPEETVTIKRLDYGEQADLQDLVSSIDITIKEATANPKPSISIGRFRIYLLVYGIKFVNTTDSILSKWKPLENKPNTPEIIQHKINIIRQLDDTLGGFLFEQINLFNGPLDETKKKN